MNEPVFLSEAIEFAANGAAAPPAEFRVLKAGVNPTTKGPLVFSATAWRRIQARQKERGYGLRLPFDRNHDFGAAAGWFTLAERGGELWASEIEWTPRAKQELADREYRYFSPALFRNYETGEVEEILNISLTNTPATNGLAPLVTSRMTPENLAKFGAKDEADAAAKFAALQASESALQKAAQDLNTQVAALSAKVAGFEAAGKAAEKDALITKLSNEGKLPPALLAWAKSQTVEVLTSFGDAAPATTVVTAEASRAPTAAGSITTLSDDERKICAQLNLSEADFLAGKKEYSAKPITYQAKADVPKPKDSK